MKFFMSVLILSLSLLISSCTDSQKANFNSLGNQGEITCYSGGKEIYKGVSTGKIATVSNSDGWEFKDSKTGKFIRVSGDCVITN